MRQFVLMLVLGLGLMVLPQNTFAQDGHDHMDHAGMERMGMEPVSASTATDQATETAPLEEVDNPLCPVSGEKVGEMGEAVKYEYNGKVYNLCCPMCKKDFAKDPEKFSKKAEEQEGKVSSQGHEDHDHGK